MKIKKNRNGTYSRDNSERGEWLTLVMAEIIACIAVAMMIYGALA